MVVYLSKNTTCTKDDFSNERIINYFKVIAKKIDSCKLNRFLFYFCFSDLSHDITTEKFANYMIGQRTQRAQDKCGIDRFKTIVVLFNLDKNSFI